jgi:hypothetical protein
MMLGDLRQDPPYKQEAPRFEPGTAHCEEVRRSAVCGPWTGLLEAAGVR